MPQLKSTINFYYNRYRASQPKAIRQLLDIQFDGTGQRKDKEDGIKELAIQLADLGYAIDVPIMVTGLDPQTIMAIREQQGFTWVPSAKMDPIQVMPGLTFPGSPSYDPKLFPPGSIKVITDPNQFEPASDMQIAVKGDLSNKPWSWLAMHSFDYEAGLSTDPNGVGALYSLAYNDINDVGCRGSIAGAGKKFGAEIYEKVTYAGYGGRPIVQWERQV